MAKSPPSGNVVAFSLAIILVVISAGAGVFYLIPGIFHPFTSDTTAVTYAHIKHAAVCFLFAVAGLVIMNRTYPAK